MFSMGNQHFQNWLMKKVEPKAVTQWLYDEIHVKLFLKAQYDVLHGQKGWAKS